MRKNNLLLYLLNLLYLISIAISQENISNGVYQLFAYSLKDSTEVLADSSTLLIELNIYPDNLFHMKVIEQNEVTSNTEGSYVIKDDVLVMTNFLKAKRAEITKAFCAYKIEGQILSMKLDSVEAHLKYNSLTEMFNFNKINNIPLLAYELQFKQK